MTLLLVRLPRRAVLGGVDVVRLARAAGDRRDPPALDHVFGLHPHERRFVRALLEARSQLWVYRSDQRAACGDLVVVDMSAPLPLRRCVVLELKQRTPLRERPRHVQLAAHARVAAELCRRGVLAEGAEVTALVGSARIGDVG